MGLLEGAVPRLRNLVTERRIEAARRHAHRPGPAPWLLRAGANSLWDTAVARWLHECLQHREGTMPRQRSACGGQQIADSACLWSLPAPLLQ